MLIEIRSKGANLLLNVGLTARRYLDYRTEIALKAMGDWMKYSSASIYECTQTVNEYKIRANYLYT